MTGFSVEKDGSMSGGLEDWATSAGKAFGKAKKLFSVVTTGFEDFQNLDEAIRGSGTSFNDYIKYLSRSEDATEAFGLATLYTRARVLLLNMALSTGLALAASLIVKKISEAAQSIETNIGYSVFITCGGILCPLLFVIVISGKADPRS